MLIISKFGDSSLATEYQFKKVKKIIEEDNNRRTIIVSALENQNMKILKRLIYFLSLVHLCIR